MTRALILCILTAFPAAAHDWYDPACCDGKDCQPVRPDRVTATADGWRIQISPGDHVLSNRELDMIVPYDSPRVRPSLDGDYHVCISPMMNSLYCVYVPPMGS